jgi:hypothetical protein
MGFRKIVSGGQTGVDRGARDAALAVGFACGGWCPEGRKAADGVIGEKYPLVDARGQPGPESRYTEPEVLLAQPGRGDRC